MTTSRYARPATWVDTPDHDAVAAALGVPELLGHPIDVRPVNRVSFLPPVTGPQPAVHPAGATAWAGDDQPTVTLTLEPQQ